MIDNYPMDTKKTTSILSPPEGNATPRKNTLRHQTSTPSKKQLKFLDECSKKNKKRKKESNTNEKMKNIINNIEKEIEEQLDLQTENNDFITTNVKAILKEVIMDEDIKEMVRKTLHPGESTKSYEPRLTRAKVRELLKLRPDLSLPILWPIPSKNTNFVSECLSLINADYSENSSEDEEYKPDDDEKSEYADSLFPSECDNLESERDLNDSFDVQDMSNSVGTHTVGLEIEENIGQRTRSKLPLTETPLEVIEQAFVPPDITIDMYETECDNEDWCNFIKGFSQPIDYLNLEHPDDPEDDPEYTIQADEETVDREELRKDKAVEVPSNEVEELIAELVGEYEQSLSGEKVLEMNSNESAVVSNMSAVTSKSTEPPPKLETGQSAQAVKELDCPVLTNSQKLLFEQQLRQHVQLTLMHFLQCYKHPTLFVYADELKTTLVSLQSLAGLNKKSAFYASNLDSALMLVNEWEKIRADVPKPKRSIFQKKRTARMKLQFPAELLKVVCKSDAFLYPLLLPARPFAPLISQNVHKKEMTKSEEWLLASGLQQFTKHVQDTQTLRISRNVLWETLKLIVHYLLPQFTPTFLYRFIKRRSSESTNNCIKYYLENKRAPPLKHYIVPISSKPVCQQPLQLLPSVWEDYLTENFVVVHAKK